MQAKVISIDSGTEFGDGRRRITLKFIRTTKDASDFTYDRVRMAEKDLGIAGLKLDDIVDVQFACEATLARRKA